MQDDVTIRKLVGELNGLDYLEFIVSEDWVKQSKEEHHSQEIIGGTEHKYYGCAHTFQHQAYL